MTRNKLIRYGMFCMLLGSIFFSLMNSALKVLSNHITINENLFFRGFTMALFVAVLMFAKSKKNTNKHHNKSGGWVKLIFRAFVGTTSLYAMLYNIETIPLGTSIAFAQTAPIWTAIFAFLILRDKISISVGISVVIGFIGVILISNPETSNLPIINIFCGIISGIFAALAFVSIRSLKGYFDDLTIMLSFGIMATLIGLTIILIKQDGFSDINLRDWFFIIIVGITGTIGQYYITRAYTFAPPGIVSPIDYTRIFFSSVFGIILGDSVPNVFIIFGMFFIILSGIIIALPVILKEFNKAKG
ncbi:DMT family transporter [Helicobacter sp. MIT 14-3879]|uniref:DMT family transporter n=1 Tax=Helicobacter sp. MIT 14-3879 TaxID=2040649 RepID=UPI000E1E52D0|nr:DMT family transporter [Helicobacter sp. MIT 14-3879]RDU60927.1 hypothetical protein CQA44_09880 [Helicobacter sp. MIT 14-3879]